MGTDPLLEGVERYYTAKVETHGATPEGADWSSAASQQQRFAQLLRLCDRDEFSLLDYGCGYGALLDRARAGGRRVRYVGYDLSETMLARAREQLADDPSVTLTADASELEPCDYVLASGIFNVRLQTSHEQWGAYVLETIGAMARLSRVGFAFNMLTRYADPGRMQDHLHYADPSFLLAHCATAISRHVALHQDYGLYEFTVLVRHESSPLEVPARPN